MASRFLNPKAVTTDNSPPKCSFHLVRAANQPPRLEVELQDDVGLRAMVYFDLQRGSVVGGRGLSGMTASFKDPVPAELAPFLAQARTGLEAATDGLQPQEAIEHLQSTLARTEIEASRLGIRFDRGLLDADADIDAVSQADGLTYYYDINATSNFVANAPAVVGFDPTARFVDYIVRVAEDRLARLPELRAQVAAVPPEPPRPEPEPAPSPEPPPPQRPGARPGKAPKAPYKTKTMYRMGPNGAVRVEVPVDDNGNLRPDLLPPDA